MSKPWVLSSALLALSAGLACPEHVTGDGAPANSPCADVGQRCEVSPGKLGTCVLIDDCRQSNCYVCQSQH
jgi:hypothetical protein